MMKRIFTFAPTLLFLFVISLSVFNVAGAEPLAVKCANDDCTFQDLQRFVNRALQYLIKLAPMVAAIGFGIAGFYYATDRGTGTGVKKAHDIFYWTLIGFLVMLSAWLVIKTILVGLGVSGDFQLLE